MSGPAWLAAGFAALMIAVAALCAGRLVIPSLRGTDTERGVDGLHAVMGVAMAGMLEPRLIPILRPAWAAVFAAAAAWFTWRGIRPGGRAGGICSAHPAAHAVECAAMVYMLVPAGSWPSGRGQGMAMPGMSQGATFGNPALTLLLALFMLGYVVWAVDRLAFSSRALAAAAASGAATSRPGRPPAAALPAPAAAGVPAAGPDAFARPALAPRLAACYKIAMGITMGYMLVMMLLKRQPLAAGWRPADGGVGEGDVAGDGLGSGPGVPFEGVDRGVPGPGEQLRSASAVLVGEHGVAELVKGPPIQVVEFVAAGAGVGQGAGG
jgi:hypothetical protein